MIDLIDGGFLSCCLYLYIPHAFYVAETLDKVTKYIYSPSLTLSSLSRDKEYIEGQFGPTNYQSVK